MGKNELSYTKSIYYNSIFVTNLLAGKVIVMGFQKSVNWRHFFERKGKDNDKKMEVYYEKNSSCYTDSVTGFGSLLELRHDVCERLRCE